MRSVVDLAATGRADQDQKFVVRDVEIDVADRNDVVVLLHHVTQCDFGHGRFP